MTVNTWHHCIERFGTISRTLNYYDNKTGETFFRKEVYGEASFAKRYRVNGKEHWTPFLKNPKDVLSFIKDEKAKERLHLTGYYKSDKHKFKDVYYASFENEKRKCELYQTSAGTLDHYQGTMRKYILADNLPYDTPKNRYIEDMTIMDHKLFKHTINELYHDKLSQSRIEQIFGCYNKVSKYAWQCNMISKDILIESDVQAMGKKQPSKEIIRNFLSYREYDIFTDTYRSYAFDYFDNALQSYANGKLAKNDGYKEIVKFRYLLYQAYFSFIFYTGARKNEARGTLWRDLDLCDPYEIYTVMIDKQYDERYQRVFEEQYTLRKPKYDSARRCVLHEQLIDDLKELKDWL